MGFLSLWFEASQSADSAPWWVGMIVPEGVEGFAPLWFGLSVSDVVGAYWRYLSPGRVAVSVARCAELSVPV